MEAAGVRRGVGSVEAALLPLHQLFARRTAAKPPVVAAAAVADDWSVMARLEKPGAMKRSRAAIRFNEPRSRGSRSVRGSRAVHCAIRQILKERHRGWVRTGASVREGRTPFFSRGETVMCCIGVGSQHQANQQSLINSNPVVRNVQLASTL